VRAFLPIIFAALVPLLATLPAQNKGALPVPPPLDLYPPELPELVTEGLDFTDSTQVVGTGVFQFENAYTIARERGVHSFTGPQTLVRIGLTKRLELRLGGDGFRSEHTQGNGTTSGWSDLELAVKVGISKQSRFRPALSMIPMLSLPAGGSSFSSGGYDPTLKLAWDKDLARGFSIGGNINVSSLRTPTGRFRQAALSTSVSRDLKAGFGVSLEVFGLSSEDKDGPSAWVANTGVSHGIGKHAQIDAQVGRRIGSAGPDWFCAIGTALRHPRQLFIR
jgi:hypothetical protein